MSMDFVDDALPTPDLSPEEDRALFERSLLGAVADRARRGAAEDEARALRVAAARARAEAAWEGSSLALSLARDLNGRLARSDLVLEMQGRVLQTMLIVLKVCHPDEAAEIGWALGKLKAAYEAAATDKGRAALVAPALEQLGGFLAVFEGKPAPAPARPLAERLKLIHGGLAGLEVAHDDAPA